MKKENVMQTACQIVGKQGVEHLEEIHGEYCESWMNASFSTLENCFPLDCFANYLQFYSKKRVCSSAFSDLLRLEQNGFFLEISVQTSWVKGEPRDRFEY